MQAATNMSNEDVLLVVYGIIETEPASIGIREIAKIANGKSDASVSLDRVKNAVRKIRKGNNASLKKKLGMWF